ncbi:hypothetical protein ACW5WG_21565, partial [Aeromonas salmonicida]
WSACQKAPSVTVTWGWGNHDLLADLGNNATPVSSACLNSSLNTYFVLVTIAITIPARKVTAGRNNVIPFPCASVGIK